MAQSFAAPQAGRDGGDVAKWTISDRVKSLLGVAALHGALFYLLSIGLGVKMAQQASDALATVTVIEALPPPEQAAPEASVESPASRDPQAGESPRDLKATPPPLVVPPPVISIPVSLPLIAAPLPAEGVRANAGSAPAPGPGSERGGQGSGDGSGVAGAGAGGGGVAIKAERIKGRIRGSDYPEPAYRRHASGTVFLSLTVGADGRVSHCAVDESSGHADLDAATCALIVKRYRYRPARDARGRAVPDTVNLAQVWETTERR